MAGVEAGAAADEGASGQVRRSEVGTCDFRTGVALSIVVSVCLKMDLIFF